MQGHYGSLAADTTGHSLTCNTGMIVSLFKSLLYTPTIRNSDILDQDFSWNQIAAALLQMSPRKAPGDDGNTTAFYQAALYMPANTQEGVPTNPICSCSVESMWSSIRFSNNPPCMAVCIHCSITRKMATLSTQATSEALHSSMSVLKLVCKAGFRKREECVGQVVSLVDIIQRRQNAGLNTHVLFIDIRKAFDTVPVGALLWKLQNMGFPRRTLAFLKALYTSSSARARAGSLSIGPIPIPGLPRDTNPSEDSCTHDVAVFADSEQSLLAASTAIEQWANRWEMQFGVAKCGIIQLHWPSSTTT
ncbi:hypothetical protein BASA83_010315 [Batrachochytrium salamandrivorans]|nr:hypothetical protein BASA83_010315 [Batrachochytrium salamandrivorans]